MCRTRVEQLSTKFFQPPASSSQLAFFQDPVTRVWGILRKLDSSALLGLDLSSVPRSTRKLQRELRTCLEESAAHLTAETLSPLGVGFSPSHLFPCALEARSACPHSPPTPATSLPPSLCLSPALPHLCLGGSSLPQASCPLPL